MPRNGSGLYTLPYNWNDDKANGIKVLASRMENQDQDIANALSDSLAADGQTPLTGDLDFNGNRAIDLDDGQDTQDAAVIGQVQTGELQYYGVSSTVPLGTDGLNYEVNANPTLLEYVDGLEFSFVAHYTCIDNPRLRVDTLGQKDLVKDDGNGGYTNLGIGNIIANHPYNCYFNSGVASGKIIVKNILPQASETVKGVAEIATQAETNTGTDDSTIITPLKLASKPGLIAQVVNFQTGAVGTGTAQIPYDDTIPQSSEGTEFMSLSITPKSLSNKLKIDVVMTISCDQVARVTAALFKDSGTNALAVGSNLSLSGVGYTTEIVFSYFMTANTTSSTTFKVRAGPDNPGTVTFNGQIGARKYGGAILSSITITEITA